MKKTPRSGIAAQEPGSSVTGVIGGQDRMSAEVMRGISLIALAIKENEDQ